MGNKKLTPKEAVKEVERKIKQLGKAEVTDLYLNSTGLVEIPTKLPKLLPNLKSLDCLFLSMHIIPGCLFSSFVFCLFRDNLQFQTTHFKTSEHWQNVHSSSTFVSTLQESLQSLQRSFRHSQSSQCCQHSGTNSQHFQKQLVL